MEGYEINLTQLADYVWCPNKPILALKRAKEIGIIGEEFFEEKEIYIPKIILAKESEKFIGNGIKVYFVPDYYFQNIFGECIKSCDLTVEVFAKIKEDLRMFLDPLEWNELTLLMGEVAEVEYGKIYNTKHIFGRVWGEFLVKVMPDAIFDDTVYEFKTVQHNKDIEKQIEIAKFQADLTCYLFGFDFVYVEVMSFEDMKVREYRYVHDFYNTINVLNEIYCNYKNNILYDLEKDFKCKNCKYENYC